MGDAERLPIMEGVRRSDYEKLITSVFHKPKHVDRDMLRYYKRSFESRRWKKGFLRTVRGTNDHMVRQKLPTLQKPVLLISGREDKIVDPAEGERAAADLPQGHYLSIPHCGHALRSKSPGW